MKSVQSMTTLEKSRFLLPQRALVSIRFWKGCRVPRDSEGLNLESIVAEPYVTRVTMVLVSVFPGGPKYTADVVKNVFATHDFIDEDGVGIEMLQQLRDECEAFRFAMKVFKIPGKDGRHLVKEDFLVHYIRAPRETNKFRKLVHWDKMV